MNTGRVVTSGDIVNVNATSVQNKFECLEMLNEDFPALADVNSKGQVNVPDLSGKCINKVIKV